MNLSTKQTMCFFYHPSFRRDPFVNMGNSRFYNRSLRIDTRVDSFSMNVTLTGQLDSSTIEQLDEFLLSYREEVRKSEIISFDIRGLEYINRFGMYGLLDLVHVLKHEGLQVSFRTTRNRADRMLQDAGFYTWLENK
ncbi:STAS domain-containing protein [Rossellomorea aquimaris]|uniref:STAS domain-containing protein n=1 Tax=Rossellomorea aquimaris TaxID=189382 RepID=UPI001CD3C815|nr:STAS domain-containing protein [Rossellomorea aquimaris]MCA1055245.1 STAS domain-containing protein [Rossellomorea aquimaris]